MLNKVTGQLRPLNNSDSRQLRTLLFTTTIGTMIHRDIQSEPRRVSEGVAALRQWARWESKLFGEICIDLQLIRISTNEENPITFTVIR